MSKWIGPIVKQVWNVALLLVQIFFLGGGCHKQNTLPLGQIQPSSPSTEELDALGLEVVLSSLLLSL